MSAVALNSNIASLNAQRRLGESTASLSRSFERLSSGLRINRASDDAAGLAIAASLNVDVRVFRQGVRNVSDGLSYLDNCGPSRARRDAVSRVSEPAVAMATVEERGHRIVSESVVNTASPMAESTTWCFESAGIGVLLC